MYTRITKNCLKYPYTQVQLNCVRKRWVIIFHSDSGQEFTTGRLRYSQSQDIHFAHLCK